MAIPVLEYLKVLQKRIYHFEEIYNNSAPIKRLNLEFWSNPLPIVNSYIYLNNRKGDLFKQVVALKIILEKDEKVERGWILPDILLKNCKYDALKCCIEINEKNENKKLSGVMIALFDKEYQTIPSISLPLLFR